MPDLKTTEHQGRSLKYLMVEPDDFEPNRAYPLIILLHGYGAHMSDLTGLSPMIDSQNYIYAFPNGPISLTIGYGIQGYAWSASVDGRADEGLQSSADNLIGLFEEITEQYKIDPDKVVLGGFSQGGMMAYLCGLPNPSTFAGIAALSSKIPEPTKLESLLPEDKSQLIFISHGTADPLLPVENGRHARLFLEQNEYSPDYREYDMGHQIIETVIRDLTHWIRNVVASHEVDAKDIV